MWLLLLVAQVHLTVYSGGFGLVEETRTFRLRQGTDTLETPELAPRADLTTVSLALPSGEVREKRILYAQARPEALASGGLEQPVEVALPDDLLLSGILLGVSGEALVLKTSRGVVTVPRQQVRYWLLKQPPKGLRARPLVQWVVTGARSGSARGVLRYQTEGLGWQALYRVRLQEKHLDLSGFIHLSNTSGKDFDQAALTLIAGEVHRLPAPPVLEKGRGPEAFMALAPSATPVQQPLAEYHRYDLPGRYTLKDHEDLQVRLFPDRRVPAEERYVYRQGNEVMWHLRFVNAEDPMPAGRVRVYQVADRHEIFVGEDWIGHVPQGDTVDLSLGKAFDLRARETVEASKRVGPGVWERTVAITFRNFKDQTVRIQVIRSLPEGFELIQASEKPSRKTARTLEFWITVPAHGQKVLRYTVQTRS